ncbi:MAG: hypothetical protein AUI47_01425 [Acidobacteria bacterium 13_1_40CM_2_68_5]|nr:MAG: hypothetical protein AUI47_01425 [Acidobacteria bacterium 13_1_40CM_2_68_5]
MIPDSRSDVTAGAVGRSVCFGSIVGATIALFWTPLTRLVQFSFEQQHYSHVILVPVLSAWLFVRERRRIFSHVETSGPAGVAVLVAGGLLYGLGQRYFGWAGEHDELSVAIFAVVLFWLGGFVLCYGVHTLRRGLFPALLLFLMTPIPEVFLSRVISWLQSGSAEVSYAAFQLLGVPVFRTGFVFSLPGISIEIAQECSGIRSSLALLITSLLAGHLFLRSPWAKALLILAALPLIVVKNGIRIVTLTLLSMHVDPGFLTGNLHNRGGIVFFLVALGLLASVLRSLQQLERSAGTNAV